MANVQLSLKQLCMQRFNITITKRMIDQLVRVCTLYEVRDDHVEALNSPMLGVNKIHFFDKDQRAVFDVFEVDRNDFAKMIQQSGLNKDFKVSSDVYNVFTVYMAHCIMKSSLPKSVQEEGCFALWKMLQYKFFSSIVNHMLPYKPNPDVMQATLDGLSAKFDIVNKETNTWKLVMEARARELCQKEGNIHYHSILNFTPDQKVVYVLSDVQTRLRTKIKLVVQEYYKTLEEGKRIASTTMTTDDLEGEKIVKELTGSLDNMIAVICNKALNANQFIRNDVVRIVSKLVPNIRPDMMRTLLMFFSNQSVVQYQKHKQDEIDKTGRYLIGYHILITEIIQRSYRLCILEKVNMKSRLAILDKVRNTFRSSRVNDPDILRIKDSVEHLVEIAKVTNRDSTKASLKIAFILYIILLTFDYD